MTLTLWLLGAWALLVTIGAFSPARSWTHAFALAVDVLTFSIIRQRFDITISSWCGLQLRRGARGAWFGRILGTVLNHIETNHCELAIAADADRARTALQYLGPQGLP